MDLDILAAMRLRDNHDKYSRFVKQSSLSEESWSIFTAMGDWFTNNPDKDEIDWQSFSAWLMLVRYAKMDKQKALALKAIVNILAERGDGEDEYLTPLIEGLAKRDVASRIGEVALRIADGDYSLNFDTIDNMIIDHNRLIGRLTAGDETAQFSLEDLQSVTGDGLQWRLKCLQEACGPVRKSDFIVFGKRPDTGGTTFMSSEVSYMAEQLDDDLDVFWFNNEEGGNKVRRRIVQAATGWSSEHMERDLKGALNEYAARMGRMDKIRVIDQSKIHVKDVERVLRKGNPGLIIFDQLWKVKGFDQEGQVQGMTSLFGWGRELCKEYAPVMAVHQAGAEADNIKWIEQGMLYFGKTGPQGEADAIITMGRLTDRGNMRYLYVPKNKLQTPGNPAMRNGKYEIEIDPNHARFKEFV